VLRVVRSSDATKPDQFQFTVTDTGIGIAEDQIQRIFDEFHQADASTTRSYGGTGLGLAISSRLIALMQGKIWVESHVGQGSQFYFTIPLDVALDTPSTGLQHVTHVAGTRVLVVDDNATNRRILNDMLLNWGMEPITVSNAKDALQSLKDAHHQDQPFRLMLTDVNMPHDDGFALTGWLRDVPELEHLPVVMLTSSGRPGDMEQRKELHVAAYLLKPVKQSELFDTIVTVLGVTQVEDESADQRLLPDSTPARSLHVLLAEDNVVNQKLAVGVLEKLGHRVTLASNGRQAVDACRRKTFDVVLMDVQMPEMDGLEATRFLRKAETVGGDHLPIVAMTAHAMKGDKQRCLEAGMDLYLAKPFRMRELADTLIAATTGERSPSRQETEADGDAAELIDWSAALQGVGGDQELLITVTEAFLEESPTLLKRLHEAVDAQDPVALNSAAHTLKGSLAIVGALTASEHVVQLELMGKQQDMSAAAKTLEIVDQLCSQLLPLLRTVISQGKIPNP